MKLLTYVYLRGMLKNHAFPSYSLAPYSHSQNMNESRVISTFVHVIKYEVYIYVVPCTSIEFVYIGILVIQFARGVLILLFRPKRLIYFTDSRSLVFFSYPLLVKFPARRKFQTSIFESFFPRKKTKGPK